MRYIAMCLRATQIQEIWKPEAGDFVWDNAGSVYPLSANNVKYYHKDKERINKFLNWMPRQDQLQDMVKPEPECAFNHVGQLVRWIDKNVSYACSVMTMEQLWLTFVMSKNYDKKWEGEKWVSMQS